MATATKAAAATATGSYTITIRGLLPARALRIKDKVTATGVTRVVTGLLTNRSTSLVDGRQVQVDMPPIFLRFREVAGKAALATEGYTWALVQVSGWIAPLGAPIENERGYLESPSMMVLVDRLEVIKVGDPVEPDA